MICHESQRKAWNRSTDRCPRSAHQLLGNSERRAVLGKTATHPFPAGPVGSRAPRPGRHRSPVVEKLESDPTARRNAGAPPHPSRSSPLRPVPPDRETGKLCSTNSSVPAWQLSHSHAVTPLVHLPPPRQDDGDEVERNTYAGRGHARPALVSEFSPRRARRPRARAALVYTPRGAPCPFYPGWLNESSPFATLRGTGAGARAII